MKQRKQRGKNPILENSLVVQGLRLVLSLPRSPGLIPWLENNILQAQVQLTSFTQHTKQTI